MDNAYRTINRGGFTAKLYQDQDPQKPDKSNDDGKLSTLVTWYRSYMFDEDGQDAFGSLAEFIKMAKREKWFYLPVSMLDHSGIHLYEGTQEAVSDPGGWDSGQVGFIYCSPARARELFCVKRLSHKRVYENLRADLKEWDQYVTGDVYGYVVEGPDGNQVDSCWGFYGHEYAMQEMESALDREIKWELSEAQKIEAIMRI